MRILFLGLNYAPEEIGIAVYTSGLCEDLAAAGHQVRVIAAHPYYPRWKIFAGYGGGWRRGRENGVDLTRCPIYVPAAPTGPKRLVHHVSFALSAFFPMIKAGLGFKPDVVITVAPSLVAAPLAWIAARLAGAKSWLHVQDFEVEAAFATGLLDDQSRAARVARAFERGMIKLFDRVSSISPEMCRKLAGMSVAADQIYEFRNWADISRVTPLDSSPALRADWEITTPHVALYSGNIANKQGIEIIVQAAQLLKQRDDLTFVICGEGPNRRNLEEQARDLPNIRFHDLQPVERLGELLGLATVHLLPQKADAADLVLPSKLTNMLASGRPVVATAAPGTGLAREVEGAGFATPPEDTSAFATAIEALIDDPTIWRRLSANARTKATTVWNRQSIVNGLVENLEELCRRPAAVGETVKPKQRQA
jgi:colanic acid biosynthesis glycosyl transferase WcaI